jgi:transcriptional regulator with XRE-family HTH domain
VNKTRDKTILIQFGSRLKDIRKLKNLSQDELALEADIEKSQIYRIEKGLINPTVTSIINISRALGVKPLTLFETFE